jgi:copper chaperone NosL
MRRRIALVVLIVATAVLAACARGVEPAPLDTANTACRYCRMAVSDVHFAAQIVAPGVEPQFFDDIGCLANYLKQPRGKPPAEAVVFVADHRTGAWVRASSAVFTRTDKVSTPMGGGIIAHASEDSKKQDPASEGGTSVAASEILGPGGVPNGGRP